MALLRRRGQLWITTERSDRAGHYCLPNPTWEQENWNAKYFSKMPRCGKIPRPSSTLPVGPVGKQRRDNELLQKYWPTMKKIYTEIGLILKLIFKAGNVEIYSYTFISCNSFIRISVRFINKSSWSFSSIYLTCNGYQYNFLIKLIGVKVIFIITRLFKCINVNNNYISFPIFQ